MLDRVEYVPKADALEKTITKVVTVTPKEMALELEALSAQLADLKAGKTETPEDQAVIDAAIANYEEQKVILEAAVTKLPPPVFDDTPVIGGMNDPRLADIMRDVTNTPVALSANTVVEVRTAGNDTNGGAFVTGASGQDYSLQDSKNTVGADISVTNAVAIGTAVITSATANFGTTIVGNIIYMQGGTGTLAAGWYQVLSRASTTSITVDRNVAAGTGITMNIGGALVSPGMASGIGLVSGAIIWIKNTNSIFVISNLTPGTSGGNISLSLTFVHIEGYETTRGDFGTPPILLANGLTTAGNTLVGLTGPDSSIYNIEVDADATSNLGCILLRGLAYRVSVSGGNRSTLSGFGASTALTAIRCTASLCAGASAFLDTTAFWCSSYENTTTGFSWGGAGRAVGCISANNSGGSSDGFNVGAQGFMVNCVAYTCGRAGFRLEDDIGAFLNCIAEGNVTGFDLQSRVSALILNTATFGNTNATANTGGKAVIVSNTVLSASPFVSAAGYDFALNNTASAGAACRAAGFPGVMPVGGTGYQDIGALQHADPSTRILVHPGMAGGMRA